MAHYHKELYDEIKKIVPIEDYAYAHLAPIGKTYVCPICKSGTGKNKTPAFSLDSRRYGQWKCFSCGNGGNILDLVGALNYTDDGDTQLEILANEIGYDLTMPHQKQNLKLPPPAPVSLLPDPEPTVSADQEMERGRLEMRAYIKACQDNISDPSAVAYLASRGITLDEAIYLGLGYDASYYEGKNDDGSYRERSRRLIIPYPGVDYYYVARDIDNRDDVAKYRKPYSKKTGAEPLFNAGAINENVFVVCEGQLDAMSFMLSGIPCACVGGTGTNRLLDQLNAARFSGVVLLAFDNDETGAKHAQELTEALSSLGIASMYAQGFNCASNTDYKDADEYRAFNGTEALYMLVQKNIEDAYEYLVRKSTDSYNEAMERLHAQDPASVAERIFNLTDAVDPISTGFRNLDSMLDGGVRPGSLIALGALSSMGKTTLVLNIADNIAASGYPVLFVSVEQRAPELVSKSLSCILRANMFDDARYCPSATEIRSATRRALWTEQQTYTLSEAVNHYTSIIAPNLRIMEGSGRPKVTDIANVAAHMTTQYGVAPVVIIDYLQLLEFPSERDTDKSATDKNVLALRQLAGGEFTSGQKMVVIAISSINRTSYNDIITLESFKESGAVEYGSDVLLGLQPDDMANRIKNGDGSRAENARQLYADTKEEIVRAIEITMLKNRGGKATGHVSFLYNAINDRFQALDKPKEWVND